METLLFGRIFNDPERRYIMKYTTRQITTAAVIAAAYLAITAVFAPISFGLVQFRIAESLMLLSALTPAAVPGLFIGCLLANMIGGLGLIDIIFGSLATLGAAWVTYYLARKLAGSPNKGKVALFPGPTVIINGFIVGGYLPFLIPEIRDMADSFFIVLAISVSSVMLGQLVVTYALGMPLYFAIKKTKIFKDESGIY